MLKKAILTYGNPQKNNNFFRFEKDTKRNLFLMKEIANALNYEDEQMSLDKLPSFLDGENNYSKDILFYFTGHADKDYLVGNSNHLTNNLLSKINMYSGEKFIVLDACAGCYKGGENFEALNIPENSKIITGKEVSDRSSLAMILYDLLIFRKIPFEKINKKTFDEIKQNWVYFKKTK